MDVALYGHPLSGTLSIKRMMGRLAERGWEASRGDPALQQRPAASGALEAQTEYVDDLLAALDPESDCASMRELQEDYTFDFNSEEPPRDHLGIELEYGQLLDGLWEWTSAANEGYVGCIIDEYVEQFKVDRAAIRPAAVPCVDDLRDVRDDDVRDPVTPKRLLRARP